jgi:hypothetical protein
MGFFGIIPPKSPSVTATLPSPKCFGTLGHSSYLPGQNLEVFYDGGYTHLSAVLSFL